MSDLKRRAGDFRQTVEGYLEFRPAPLPPDPAIKMDSALTKLLSDADRAIGRLDGVASVLPNPNLFVAMYVRHEAVLSSQIEGTQSTLQDVLEFEISPKRKGGTKDVEEVVNYVAAMNHGIQRLETLPLSLRLIREIHEILMKNVRGSQRTPGQFRTTQNWIGAANSTVETADFVPPSVPEMKSALNNFEQFLHEMTLPSLVQTGIAHAQFETIHPFLDGNGRVGRLLITLFLCQRGILSKPLLYLSYYLKAHRAQYYDRLMAIRHDGDWEGWLKFYLRGVYEISRAATDTARRILDLREHHRDLIGERLSGSANGLRLLDLLFQAPLLSITAASKALDCSYVTARTLVSQLQELEIVEESTGQKRNRIYKYCPYLDLFSSQAIKLDS